MTRRLLCHLSECPLCLAGVALVAVALAGGACVAAVLIWIAGG